MSEGKAFLKRMEPLRTSLNLFSDENNVAIATCVESTLRMLRKEGLSNPPLAAALQHHESRLNKNHATSFWKDVRWVALHSSYGRHERKIMRRSLVLEQTIF